MKNEEQDCDNPLFPIKMNNDIDLPEDEFDASASKIKIMLTPAETKLWTGAMNKPTEVVRLLKLILYLGGGASIHPDKLVLITTLFCFH